MLMKKEAKVVLSIIDEAENMLDFGCLEKDEQEALASACEKLRQAVAEPVMCFCRNGAQPHPAGPGCVG